MPRVGTWRRWRFSLALITIAAACVCALFRARPLLFPGLVEQGIAAYDRGDWVAAAALANARLKTVTDDKEALRLLARSSVRQRRDKLARISLSAAGKRCGAPGRRPLPIRDCYRPPGRP